MRALTGCRGTTLFVATAVQAPTTVPLFKTITYRTGFLPVTRLRLRVWGAPASVHYVAALGVPVTAVERDFGPAFDAMLVRWPVQHLLSSVRPASPRIERWARAPFDLGLLADLARQPADQVAARLAGRPLHPASAGARPRTPSKGRFTGGDPVGRRGKA